MPPAAVSASAGAAHALDAADSALAAATESFEVVLVTGGAGFVGQHVVKLLQERDTAVKEIRVLDLKPYENKLGHVERVRVRAWRGDVRDEASEAVTQAFRGAHCVMHCAAQVAYGFPYSAHMQQHAATEDVATACVNLCVRWNVPRLVACGCASVSLTPYLRASFCLAALATEARAPPPPPGQEHLLLDGGHAAAMLRAERRILAANGRRLRGGGVLYTAVLRPTPLYGEGDPRLIPCFASVAATLGGSLPQLGGPHGKHQVTYVGNAAWALLCAKDALRGPRAADAAGLPSFVTDDTPPENILTFAERCLAPAPGTNGGRDVRVSSWWLPAPFGFIGGLLLECVASLWRLRLPVSPAAAARYLASFMSYDRLRAALAYGYEPIFPPEEALCRSKKYYASLAKAKS